MNRMNEKMAESINSIKKVLANTQVLKSSISSHSI